MYLFINKKIIIHVYRNLLYFCYKHFSSGFMYENCLHSCGLYAMGLVITKILQIEKLSKLLYWDRNLFTVL